MSKVAESASYGGSISALAYDGTYIYAAGATTQKVYQYDPSDMSKVAESASYGDTIYALAYDGTYIYAAGKTTQTELIYMRQERLLKKYTNMTRLTCLR